MVRVLCFISNPVIVLGNLLASLTAVEFSCIYIIQNKYTFESFIAFGCNKIGSILRIEQDLSFKNRILIYIVKHIIT